MMTRAATRAGGDTRTVQAATRIFLVDDHPLVRQGLARLIEAEPDMTIVGESEDTNAAMSRIDEVQPDVVVVDISLKDGSGIELVKQFKAQHPKVKTLISSMHDELLYAERAMRAGAMGYVNKQEAAEKVVEAIRQVLRGKVYLSQRMTDTMVRRALGGQEEGAAESSVSALSDRELEVFEMIGSGKTTREIASRLHLSVKTVETHRQHIKTKLNLDNSNELVHYAVKWVMERD